MTQHLDNFKARPVACVTGATRGIGRDIALHLAAQGYDIAFGFRDEIHASNLQEELVALGAKVFCQPLNLFDAKSINSFFDSLNTAQFGLDLLVNNAGITKDNLLAMMSQEELEQVIHVNLIAPILCAQAALKIMLPQKQGCIINMSSISATKPNPGQTNYAASKAGIEGFTRALAVEVARKNIRVNCIAPGIIETDMVSDLLKGNEQQAKSKLLSKRLGKPRDISALVAYLASQQAEFISGEVFNVNGGMLLR